MLAVDVVTEVEVEELEKVETDEPVMEVWLLEDPWLLGANEDDVIEDWKTVDELVDDVVPWSEESDDACDVVDWLPVDWLPVDGLPEVIELEEIGADEESDEEID